MEMSTRLKNLLRDYSLEDILEASELEPLEALELLVTYGAITEDHIELIEATDGTSEG